MKNLILVVMLISGAYLSAFGQGQDYLGLTSIDHGHGRFSYYKTDLRPPILVNVDNLGGVVDTYLKLKNGCTETYRFTWEFDRDVSQLRVGEAVTGTLDAGRKSGLCKNNTAYVAITGSNNGSTLLKDPRKGFGSIKVSGNRASATRKEQKHRTSEFSIIISRSSVPEEAYFTVRISTTTDASNSDVFDYEIRYNYVKNSSHSGGNHSTTSSAGGRSGSTTTTVGSTPSLLSSGPVNCHSLLGLGKLVNGLLIGAYESYGSSWMTETIGYALEHVKASKCISPAYLNDLSKRINGASNTNVFMNEISTYSRALEQEALGCNCCSGG